MSQKDLDRYAILKKVLAGEMSGTDASRALKLSTRQVRRLKRNVRKKKALGLVHALRGRPSNHRMPEKERERIVQLLKDKYSDFGPSFACEKLHDLHGIKRGPTTISNIMVAQGLWKPRKAKGPAVHRSWRVRKECFGEMVQFDGSYELWFEDRSPKTCLIAAIDDATGKTPHLKFVPHEGVFPSFGFWKEYLLAHGKPKAIYLDKFSTYKQNRPKGEEDCDLKTQFQRAMGQLGIEVIFANSPQAKGRVERLFGTLQDRLVKELRLKGISNSEAGNKFLSEIFIADFDKRFSVPPAASGDFHRPLSEDERKNLDAILSRQEERIVRNDYTVSFKNRWYQILSTPRLAVRPKDRIVIEERLDGALHMRRGSCYLSFKELPERVDRNAKQPWVLAKMSEKPKEIYAPWQPPANHPWRAPAILPKS